MPGKRDRIDTLTRIIEIQAELAEADFGLESFMQRLVCSLQDLTRASGAAIEEVRGGLMIYRAVSGIAKSHRDLRLLREGSLSGLCVTTKEVLYCKDASEDPRVDKLACDKIGLRSMICAPFFQAENPIGVLKVLSDQVAWFSDEDMHLLRLMSGMLSAALAKQLSFDRLQRSEERLRVILDNANEAVITIDGSDVVLRWNAVAEQLYGIGCPEVIGKTTSEVDLASRLYPGLHYVFSRCEASTNARWHEMTLVNREQGRLPVEFNIVVTGAGETQERTAFIREISERKSMENLLRERAQTDLLTGLPNRRFFVEGLRLAMKRQHRSPQGAALFFMDVDDFKYLNEEFGQQAGDEALRLFAHRLKSSTRETDLLARIAEDEFAILAEGIKNENDAYVLARKIVAEISQPSPDRSFSLSTSIGIAFLDEKDDAEGWLSQAAAAMNAAKRQSDTESKVAVY